MHKVYVYVDSGDTAAHAQAVGLVTDVIAEYGVRFLAHATDEQVSALDSAGFSPEIVDDLDVISLPSVVIDTREGDPPAPPADWAPAASAASKQYWLALFPGPPLPEWGDAVTAAGAEISGPMTESAVLIRATTTQANAVRALPNVQWVGLHQPLYTIEPGLAGEPGPVPVTEQDRLAKAAGGNGFSASERVQLTVSLFELAKLDAVQTAIQSAGGTVQSAGGDAIICELERSAIPGIADLAAVGHITRYVTPVISLQFARPITQVQDVVDRHGLDGTGEVVGVCDTGLDIGSDTAPLHLDFHDVAGANGRVTGYGLTGGLAAGLQRVVGGVALWNDPNGHGTHVSGIVTGTGAAGGVPGRTNRGVAPGAHLVFQSSLDNGGNLNGIPANLNNLLQPVYDTDGVRVHNNSWGMPANFGVYTGTATPRQIDEFVWRNPDMVVVFAAGNSGTDGPLGIGGPPTQDGISDLTTMNPDGTFRNGICVGGTENNRPAIPLVWNVNWATGSRFLAAPLAADRVASNPAEMMAFSGRGPTTAPSGRRIKPDIVAPGSSIFSAYSSISPTSNFWGPRPAGSPYIFMGGTSMAAPHVTGMAVLVREYLRRIHHFADKENPVRRRRRPSAALVKALLCHGGQLVTGMGPPNDNHGTLPGNHQGFGLADLRRSLFSNPIAAHAAADAAWLPRRTIFVDDPDRTLNGLPAAKANSKRLHEVQVQVLNNSVPLRATLVWTDFPGPTGHAGKLINRLQLSIRRYNANGTTTDFALAAPAGILPATMDPRTNNVQQIDISGANLVAAPGVRYGIRVSAVRINSFSLGRNEEQDFALVISGPISHSDHKVPGTIAPLPDIAFVDVQDQGGVRFHDGLAPSPVRPAANPGSPDIWVSRAANPDPNQAVATVEIGQPHFVYVKVRNLGFAPANGTQVNLYWADRTNPAFAFPGDWKTDGFKVNGASGNQRTVDVPARGETVCGPFEWSPPRGFEQLELLVRATHPDDPIVNEGDVRFDNNITSRDVTLADNTTHVDANPSGFDRFIFWLISGFSSPRDIEANLLLSYQDIRDGQVKPLPGNLPVEVFDYDPVSGDDKMGEGRTLTTTLPNGQPATHLHMTFSTIESGEGGPDIYFRIPKPTAPEFADFVAGSFFSSGADAWVSKDQPTANGGFFAEDFGDSQIGIPNAVPLVVRPVGTHVRAVLEFFSGSEYRPLPVGIPVRIVDAGDPDHVFVTARTDAHGEINTVVARGNSKPDLAFRIVKADAAAGLAGVDFFTNNTLFDSATGQVEILAADGSVASTRSGRFDNVETDELVPAGQKLRLRLESPGIHVAVRFEYFDRETGNNQPVPAGTEVEVWEDAAAATQPLVRGVIGTNGTANLAVPRGSQTSFNLFVRLVMKRRLGPDPSAANAPTVAVTKAGAPVRFDTKGQTATDGVTNGRFANVQTQVPAAGAPPTFRIGAAADPDDAHAAPFVLRVVGDVDAWLRTRSANDWTGIPATTFDIFTSAAEGSRTDAAATTIHLNSGHTGVGAAQPDNWSRAAIAHHFAHLVLEKLFAALAHGPAIALNHRALDNRTQQATRVALQEGFADYVVGRHTTPPVRPDQSANQTGWRGTDNDGTKRHGETVPMAIANALWLLDDQVVGSGHAAITDPINQHRFLALIWNPLKSLNDADVNQVVYKLYRAIQSANVAAGDLLAGHEIGFLRQRVRAIFEANGLHFTRGRITSANRQTVGAQGVWRLQLEPADTAKTHVAEAGRITAYKMQLRRTGTANFLDIEQTVQVTHANQKEQLDVQTGEALETGAVPAAGRYDWRVLAQDEFGTWETFADSFTGNANPTNTNDLWQQNQLHSLLPAPGTNNVP